MGQYQIEHKILALSHCAVMKDKEKPASFEVEGVNFSHWDFNYRDGWISDLWIATANIEANNFLEAINELGRRLSRSIPRISLISQSYIEYILEPFLVQKINSDVVFFRYSVDVHGGGLMFMEKEQKALNKLLEITDIPETFYYYWNDAVNTATYTPKLLLMFSAIEILVKRNGHKDWNLINEIFGEEIVKELFGTKKESNTGLRNRLVHGEYFGEGDHGKNYIEIIHNKVIEYFNKKIFMEELIHENVVRPQRNFFGNKEQSNFFLKRTEGENIFSLKDLLKEFNDNKHRIPPNYVSIHDKNLNKNY
jgi:hypothetical protein